MEGVAVWLSLMVTGHFIATQMGFFSLPSYKPIPQSGFALLGILLIFVTLKWATLLLQLAYPLNLSPYTAILVDIGILFAVFTWYAIWCERRGWFTWGENRWKGALLGGASWLLAYPALNLVGLFFNWLADLLQVSTLKGVEQNVISDLKGAVDSPLYFAGLLVVAIFAAPFVEEILFRGFLYGWLRNLVGRFAGNGIASCIFALIHTNIDYSWGNVPLFASVFILSLYLGYVYERAATIWASVGLHVVHNGMSIIFLFLI